MWIIRKCVPRHRVSRDIGCPATEGLTLLSQKLEPFSLLEAVRLLIPGTATIYNLIHEYERYPEVVRRLTADLASLIQSLGGLEILATKDKDHKFDGLRHPLAVCQKLCEGFQAILHKAVKKHVPERKDLRVWLKLKIRSGDIEDFGRAISNVKSTVWSQRTTCLQA